VPGDGRGARTTPRATADARGFDNDTSKGVHNRCLRQAKAEETLEHRLPEGALAARGQALLDAAAKEKENGGERGKKEETGEGAEGEEHGGTIWETTIEIAVSLTGATIPVSFVTTIKVSKGPPLGKKKPRRKSKDSSVEASRESEGEKVTKAGREGKRAKETSKRQGPLSEQQRPSLRVAEERGRGKRKTQKKRRVKTVSKEKIEQSLHRCHIFFVLFVFSPLSTL
jgi:hypothetical protein